MYPLVEDMSEIYAHLCAEEVEPWLWAYISDMSSTSGYMGAKYVQEFSSSICIQLVGPSFLDMSYCQKGSHLQRGGWNSVVGRVFTGVVIIMKSRGVA